MEETPSLTGEITGETHRVLGHTQTHPPGNQHQKGPISLWEARKVTEKPRAEQVALFPLRLLPHMQRPTAKKWVSLPWEIPKAPPLTI